MSRVDESVTSVLSRRVEVLEQLIEEARRELLAIKRMQRVAERHESYAKDLLKIDGAIATAEGLAASRGRETKPDLGGTNDAGDVADCVNHGRALPPELGSVDAGDANGSWLDGDEP